MIRRPPRSTQSRSSAASDVYKRQVLRLGEVVRDMHREAHRVVASLAEPVLEQVARAGWHLHCVDPRLMTAYQFRTTAVRDHADRAGVRDRHRNGVQPDGQPYAELRDDHLYGGYEPLPLYVRLGAGQQQEGSAGAVVQ